MAQLNIDSDDAPMDFESALEELETIVASMESGDLPLEASVQAFTRGNELLKFCQRALQDVEQRVRVLTETNTLEDFTASDAGQ